MLINFLSEQIKKARFFMIESKDSKNYVDWLHKAEEDELSLCAVLKVIKENSNVKPERKT